MSDCSSAARVDLAQYEALIIEKHLSFTGANYRAQLLETGADLRRAMNGLTSAIEYFCSQGRAERIPLSVYVSSYCRLAIDTDISVWPIPLCLLFSLPSM